MPQLLAVPPAKNMDSFDEQFCSYDFKRNLWCETNFTMFCNSPVLQFGAPPAIDSGEAKIRKCW